MAVPDYQSFMLPVLEFIGGNADRPVSMRELKDVIARKLDLSEEDLNEELPSGTQTTFTNRLSWACVYMKKAGLLTAPRRAVLQITERGKEVLDRKPDRINGALLRQFPEFVSFLSARARKAATTRLDKISEGNVPDAESSSVTPLKVSKRGTFVCGQNWLTTYSNGSSKVRPRSSSLSLSNFW